MASTIPDIDAAAIGAVSDEIATHKATQGDTAPLLANTLVAVAAAAKADVETLQGGAAGASLAFDYFADYLAEGASLLGSTATSAGPTSHSLTLGGTAARTIQVTLTSQSGAYTGTFTVSGLDVDGAALSQVLTPPDADGGVTLETTKAFAPGTVTLSRTAMTGTLGSYTAAVGRGFGLTSEAHEAGNGFGHLLSMTLDGFGTATLGASTAFIQGPTLAPPNGVLMFVAEVLGGLSGGSFEVCYPQAAA